MLAINLWEDGEKGKTTEEKGRSSASKTGGMRSMRASPLALSRAPMFYGTFPKNVRKGGRG